MKLDHFITKSDSSVEMKTFALESKIIKDGLDEVIRTYICNNSGSYYDKVIVDYFIEKEIKSSDKSIVEIDDALSLHELYKLYYDKYGNDFINTYCKIYRRAIIKTLEKSSYFEYNPNNNYEIRSYDKYDNLTIYYAIGKIDKHNEEDIQNIVSEAIKNKRTIYFNPFECSELNISDKTKKLLVDTIPYKLLVERY